MTYTLYHGDCLETLRTLPACSVDAVVTDPPSGTGFMGKDWDKDKGGRTQWVAWMAEIAAECLRVLKPGGHALVWALPRTSHWTGWAWEDAGFEPREKIVHLFGSGFPKSHDLSKAIDREAGAAREVVGEKYARGMRGCSERNALQDARPYTNGTPNQVDYAPITAPATPEAAQWDGWGTALKPATEDWWLFRKPISENTVAANVLRWGTGGVHVDACRVATEDDLNGGGYSGGTPKTMFSGLGRLQPSDFNQPSGRFPPNLLLTHSAACTEATCADDCPVAELGRQSGVGDSKASMRGLQTTGQHGGLAGASPNYNLASNTLRGHNDTGTAARFYPTFRYQAKPSRRERNAGCEGLPVRNAGTLVGRNADARPNHRGLDGDGTFVTASNHHPTVKSTALMSWLCRLITPRNGVILDPFTGSGSTGVAALSEGFRFIGIEREAEYVAIARARLEHAAQQQRLDLDEPDVAIYVTMPQQAQPARAVQARFDLEEL